MKNSKNCNPGSIEKFETKPFAFYWIFEGNGNYSQKHDEMDYRRYIERNYISKSNLEF
jgi:hypothetical protein